MIAMTEKELKQTYGERVKLPIAFINYRAIEVSVQGIEKMIKQEEFTFQRERLLKIRSQLKTILNDL